MPRRTLVLLAAAAALAGCGGGGKEAASGCARGGTAAYPAAFPASLPKPDDFRRTGIRRDGEFTVAEGSAAGSLNEVRDFFRERLPGAGYRLGEGDAEEHEAETEFEGSGVRGHLKIRDFGGCSGRVAVEVAVARG